MLDEKAAKAAATSGLGEGIAFGEARELRDGWYFPLQSTEPNAGSDGVIVNKQSGKLFHLGSAIRVDRDLELYDRGYQFAAYDLVIQSVRDREQTLKAVRGLRLTVVEPKEENGVVRNVPREMTTAELEAKLDQLPWTIRGAKLYFVVEVLENARRARWFTFDVREHVPAQ